MRSTLALTALLFGLTAGSVHACPKVDGYPDFTCNQSVDIAILGDSLAYGFGDTKNGNQGGFNFLFVHRF